MKKIFKNPIFMFVLGLIIAGTCVYAYTYDASDVGYKSTNVSDALDDLYETASKFDSITIGLKGESNTTTHSDGTLVFNNFIKSNYKYFKVSTLRTYGSSSDCKLYIYSNARSDMVLGSSNTQYEVFSSTDTYKYEAVQLRSTSTANNVWASCEAAITFYN